MIFVSFIGDIVFIFWLCFRRVLVIFRGFFYVRMFNKNFLERVREELVFFIVLVVCGFFVGWI